MASRGRGLDPGLEEEMKEEQQEQHAAPLVATTFPGVNPRHSSVIFSALKNLEILPMDVGKRSFFRVRRMLTLEGISKYTRPENRQGGNAHAATSADLYQSKNRQGVRFFLVRIHGH